MGGCRFVPSASLGEPGDVVSDARAGVRGEKVLPWTEIMAERLGGTWGTRGGRGRLAWAPSAVSGLACAFRSPPPVEAAAFPGPVVPPRARRLRRARLQLPLPGGEGVSVAPRLCPGPLGRGRCVHSGRKASPEAADAPRGLSEGGPCAGAQLRSADGRSMDGLLTVEPDPRAGSHRVNPQISCSHPECGLMYSSLPGSRHWLSLDLGSLLPPLLPWRNRTSRGTAVWGA